MSKYRAKPTTYDGIRFASKREAERYLVLKNEQRQKLIGDLKLQPRFPIYVNNQLVCTYIADFQYKRPPSAKEVIVEDSKGFRTREYILKRKLLRATHGIIINEV
jgi:hypothetical protein